MKYAKGPVREVATQTVWSSKPRREQISRRKQRLFKIKLRKKGKRKESPQNYHWRKPLCLEIKMKGLQAHANTFFPYQSNQTQ